MTTLGPAQQVFLVSVRSEPLEDGHRVISTLWIGGRDQSGGARLLCKVN